MEPLRRDDLDAVFLDAGNTLISIDHDLLVELLAKRRLATPLVPIVGFAVIVVVGQLFTLADASARFAAPVVVSIAVAGLALCALVALRRSRRTAC